MGNAHAAAGIHMLPTNRITIRNMVISGFSDGILVEGTNSSNIYDNLISNNKNGIRLIPTVCSAAAAPSTAEQLRRVVRPLLRTLIPRYLQSDHQQCAVGYFWRTRFHGYGHGLSETLNNLYMGNDLEENGVGAIYLTRSRGPIITANCFLLRRVTLTGEVVLLGMPNGGSGYRAYGTVVRDNYFSLL